MLGAPLDDPQTRRKRFAAQKDLALRDLESLQASARSLRGRQLQIFLLGVPIFFALLGTSFTMVLNPGGLTGGNPPPAWLISLPFTCLLLSFFMYGVYLQTRVSLAKQTAFCLILERALAGACFPPCYRGWTDAVNHLSHIDRYGLAKESPLQFPEETSNGPARGTKIGGNALDSLMTSTFRAVPLLSIVAMWMLGAGLGLGMTRYTVVVALSTVLLLLLGIRMQRGKNRIDGGDLSFESRFRRLDRILACQQYFDPTCREKY